MSEELRIKRDVFQIFQGILALLTPDWSHISAPWVWLESIRIVFISLQLGLGVVSTLASYNKHHHNIIRFENILKQGPKLLREW